MKRILMLSMLVAFLMIPASMQAYDIVDSPSDAIGPAFESYGINVYNFTPGVNSGSIIIDLFTDYPQAGLTVGSWNTQPADLFIDEYYEGVWYSWAIPLVTHDGLTAGNMYAVDTALVSDYFEPATGSYIYNHDVPVRIGTLGNNYGWQSFAGTATWDEISNPNQVRVNLGIYEDDPNGVFKFTWGTATCANDVITGSIPVPEPSLIMLLGLGIGAVSVAGMRRKV